MTETPKEYQALTPRGPSKCMKCGETNIVLLAHYSVEGNAYDKKQCQNCKYIWMDGEPEVDESITENEILRKKVSMLEDKWHDTEYYLCQLAAHNWYQKYLSLAAENESLRHIIEDRILDDKAFQLEYEEWLSKLTGGNDGDKSCS
jgi:hypothetical protein